MSVHLLDARVAIRVFQVTYWPNLDGPNGSEIKLGVFGDLRLGDRYALGLIARTKTEPSEAMRVGRLARHMIENPYKALRERYEEIWGSPSPPDAFERTRNRMHTSLIFSPPEEIVQSTFGVDLTESVDVARAWCMDKLRGVLRERFARWIGVIGSTPIAGREQVDELDGQQIEAAHWAVG